MSISPVMTSASTQGATKTSADTKTRDASSATATSDNSLGNTADELLNNFMTLLITQMQNQDPTNPMDNNQLTSQLAQFQTAAGVQNLNSTVESVGMLVTSMQQMSASDWVGRTVMIEGDPTVSTSKDGNKDFGFSLGSDAETVTVTLTDSAGHAYTGELKDVKAGVHKFTLDDLKNVQPGPPADDTQFNVTFNAKNADGASPDIVALKSAKVEAVSFTQSGAVLQLGLEGTATLGMVYMVE
ncbi:flagellar biosynthesis protein FlgD [Enterobacteriaceae bacterium YMB-R22]|jgi:flagellar basal-body rod modification protein FlgD|uniref:flagellar hook assembly protein FlgD n=1 Tax=Tenebrionicola larvae TaxID=2815733 RepID=UPI0020138656|nr:flagellar hook capping FlgD N-terminal domain-containing protein [Tenebrionicola larvae]MBV4413983.1 flagellar biosynthesis protein FlgD [Tenebrionicola larvae]